jgi:AcrR family transcriptional regulator/DNA-binding MarR family transcriptional regulator
VDEAQRTSILQAMAEAMAVRGTAASSVTAAEVIARAGVPAAAFHDEFIDGEALLLAAFELAVQRARKRVAPAYDAEPRWLDAIKAALAAFLRFLEQEPALGRLLVVHALSGGQQVLRRRVEILDVVADIVDRGRLEGPAGRQSPAAVTGEGVVGAVLAVLQNRLLDDRHAGVIDLYGSLVSIIVLPYLGLSVARRELARPVPPVHDATSRAKLASPDSSVGTVRLTQRTALVLGAIADYPGASNREVADRAGVVDQGQISKLLARLHAAGLIVKLGDGPPARGAPNSWRLSERGKALLGRAEDQGSAV